MSLESALSFLERIKNDEFFRAEHERITSSRERKKLIIKEGYSFTDDELSLAIDHVMTNVVKKRLIKSQSLKNYFL